MSPIASTSAVTLDDITVTFTPEPSTTTSTLTVTRTTTIEEPTTVTLTAIPTATTASFYSSLSLNSTAFERAANGSATSTLASSAIRTGAFSSGAGYSVSASAVASGSANSTVVPASSAIRTAVVATVITSEELTKAAPQATATSFRSHIGTTIYSNSSAIHKLLASSSAKSSAAKAIKTVSPSSAKPARSSKSSSSRAKHSTKSRSRSTTASPVKSTSSSKPRVFSSSSSAQAKAVSTSTASSSSAAVYVFASAAAIASSSSPAAADIIYATPVSSSLSAAASASSTASANHAGSAATRSSTATFFSSISDSPGKIAGTVVVAVAVAAVVAGLCWFFVRFYRARKDRHVQLGSDAGSPDVDGDFDEKTLKAGKAYARQPEDEEAAVQPEAIWARRLSQLQLSLVGGREADDEDDSPVVGFGHGRQDSPSWSQSGNALSVAQHLRQSRRLSPHGSTPPPPPPAMALPQLPASAHLAVPRASHPLRESTTGLARSPSMYSGDEDDRRSVESAGKQVLLGGSPVTEESVQVPAQPGSWKASLDQVMNSTADFLLGRRPSADFEAQNGDKYTVFRSQSVAVRRSPLASEFEDEEPEMSELGYIAAPAATKTWAGVGRANTLSGDMAGLKAQGSAAKGHRAARAGAKQLMLPLIVEDRREAETASLAAEADPFADPEAEPTPLEQLSAMLDLGLGDLFDTNDDNDSETSTLHRASTATSPVARSPARLVTLSRSGTGFKSQSVAMARSQSAGSAVSSASESTAKPLAGARLSRHSIDGASIGSGSGWEGDDVETDDAASIMTADSRREFRREQKVAQVDAQRRASVLMHERRRRSEGFALGPRAVPGRMGSVTSLI